MAIDTQIASQITGNKVQHGESVSRIHRLRGHRYMVQRLGSFEQHAAYQRLRHEAFIDRLGWDIPATDGREYDQYDLQESATILSFGVFGKKYRTEYFLGGVRVFALSSWDASMTMSEFRDAGMIPDPVLEKLASRPCADLIEITRLCVKRGSHFLPPAALLAEEAEGFNLAIARDLAYAAVYKVAEETGRYLALALVHSSYLQLMKRGKFIFEVLHAHNLSDRRQGYALTLIDLPATVRAIRAHGDRDRANRMLALCQDKKAFEAIHY
ncbi:hypothetical protein KSD_02380 [Ktedonobacter sp. SOSP1-85]|uniref:acyl-homoserine-lactone synthase n=1 Tax=Ktedonobacter sp. SOSP1-85 TaxID=2778367 RepID=UPI001915AE63|nr:acyl-homoserine-lactone synthase [Ktedonobacter sp. SOSP1-85]GHO72467.1 hypothetical protein KSD_02380 [Ktedonobacter sp. SOSP1-85]